MIWKPYYVTVFVLGILCCSSYSCKQNISDSRSEKKTVTQADIVQASAQLNAWFESIYQEDLNENPELQTRLGIKTERYGAWSDISEQREIQKLKKAKERLTYLNDSVTTTALDQATLLSYKMLMQSLENELEDFEYRDHNYPVNQMFGRQSKVPAFLINMHNIDSISDAKAYISRLHGIKPLFDQLIANIKRREDKGIVPPKFVFEMVLGDCRNILKGIPFTNTKEESTLFADFKHKVGKIEATADVKEALINDAKNALLTDVKPAYENLITLMKAQQKRATSDDGVWKFPEGKKCYNSALQKMTTTTLSSDEIHEIGQNEVARIHEEMKGIMKKVNFEGTLQDFFHFMKTDPQFYYPNTKAGRAAYLQKATALIDTMKTKLNQLFLTLPKADLVVQAVEPFREQSAGRAFYNRGAPDGSRPGKYYANLHDMSAMAKYEMEALAYHEGLPGHHMQLSIAQELEDIPKFRKFGGYTAYIEGWGLYNELVPKEIGMYSDPYSDFGRLTMELFRACRLVVDTGIHDKKWTREQGIEYYKINTPSPELVIVKMVERHIVMPGQATAYKIGMLKIMELRAKTKAALGPQFDIREFHDVILTNGAVPLTILEELVAAYIDQKIGVVAIAS